MDAPRICPKLISIVVECWAYVKGIRSQLVCDDEKISDYCRGFTLYLQPASLQFLKRVKQPLRADLEPCP